MFKKFIKIYDVIIGLIGALLVLILNFTIYRFQSYAAFRDYIVVRNQDFTFNNINPISFICDLLQNQLLAKVPLNQISTAYFVILFSLGYAATYFSFHKIFKLLQKPEAVSSGIILNTNPPVWEYWLSRVSLICVSLLYCYNPFVLERFLMGQERIFWGYFLILSYIYNLLKYLKEKSKKLTSAKFWLILIPIVVALSNIHLMIILSIISFGFGLAMVPKKSLLILFSGLNVVLIVFSLLLNYNFLSTPSSNYYFNNIAQNTNQTEQIITAFSPVALTNQNLGLRVLIGSASWNTPTFFETARMENKLGFFSNLSFYFNQNAGFVYLFFLILTFILGLFFVFKDKTYRNLGFPIIIFSILSLVFCFGYSFEFFRPFNQFLFSIPGSYIFREPGKIYLLFQILILVLAVVSLSKIFKSDNFLSKTKKKLLFAYPVLLCTLAVSGLIPFLALSSSLNFVQLPKIINYALNNCDNSTLAVLPNDTYIVPPSSQIFLVNPFTVSKSLGCKIIRPNKADLLQKNGDTIRLDLSGENLQLDNILENYKLNLPKQKQNSLVLDAGKQGLNSQNLVDNLKKLNISLILIDFSSIDYGFNLKSDLESKAKLIQEEGYYGLYRIN